MEVVPVASIIQLRRDTAANWTSVDPTLANGEAGYETDTQQLKIGNGSTAWTSLDYFQPGGGGGASNLISYYDLGTNNLTIDLSVRTESLFMGVIDGQTSSIPILFNNIANNTAHRFAIILECNSPSTINSDVDWATINARYAENPEGSDNYPSPFYSGFRSAAYLRLDVETYQIATNFFTKIRWQWIAYGSGGG